MDIGLIEELIKLFIKSSIKRLDISEGDLKITLEAHDAGVKTYLESDSGGENNFSLRKNDSVGSDNTQARDDSFIQISPIVGTVYLSSSPGGDPFVKVGDTVTVGQPLCIIEAMKMYSTLTARASGVIKEICVENAQAVGIGQELFKISEEQRLVS